MERTLIDRAASLLNSSPEERIVEISQKFIIEHPKYISYYNQLQTLFDNSPQFGTRGMLLVGPSGMGKSQVLYDFYRNNHPFEDENGDDHIPVLYTVMVEDPTPNGVWASLGEALKIPLAPTASTSSMRTTCSRKIKSANVRMIIIDEVQHLENTTRSGQKEQVLNLIKRLFEEFHIPIVICGIRPVLDSIEKDSQLLRRLRPFQVFKAWDFSNETRNLIADIESVLPLKKASDLHKTMLTQIILDKTHGITDFMIDFIKQAAVAAIKDGTEQITEQSMREMKWVIPEQNYQIATKQISGLFANPR